MKSYKKRTYGARRSTPTKRRKYMGYRKANYNPFALLTFPRYYADQPPVCKAKLHYTCHVSSNISAANYKSYEFIANGMYDPEASMGGHQPYGFDELMVRYNDYTVLYASITATIIGVTVNRNTEWRLGLSSSPGAPSTLWAAGGINAFSECPIKSTDVINSSGVFLAKERATSTLWFNGPTYYSSPPAAMICNADISGTAAANPTAPAYFFLMGATPDATEVGDDLFIRIDIDYYAVFSKPKMFTSS